MNQLFMRGGRLRTGWRVLSFLMVYAILLIVISIGLGLFAAIFLLSQGSLTNQLPTQIASFLTGPPLVIIAEFIQLALTLILVSIWRRWLDRKSFTSLGFQMSPGWWQDLLSGAGLIALTWLAIFAFSTGTGVVTVTGFHPDLQTLLGALVPGLILYLAVGLNEETLFRGYVFENLAEGLPLVLAILVSALIFGAAHLLNPGANLAAFLGVGLFGVLAALTYLATGRLWMPIGMHVAWNLFEGPVFGFPVSGLDMGSLVTIHIAGPTWLVGGLFGPESGVLTMAPQIVLVALIFIWGFRKGKYGRIIPPGA